MRDTRKATSPMIEIARVSTADDKSSSAWKPPEWVTRIFIAI